MAREPLTERADLIHIETEMRGAVRCEVVAPAKEEARCGTQAGAVLRMPRALGLFAQMHECPGKLDEALEKIPVRPGGAQPKHFENIVRLVVFAGVEMLEPTDIAGIQSRRGGGGADVV